MTGIERIKSQFSDSPILQRFVTGFSWLLGGGAISTLLMALSTFAIAEYLGVKTYGVIALITSTVLLTTGLLTLRTTEAITKFLIDYIEHKQREKAGSLIALGVFIDFFVALVATMVLFFASSFIVPFLFDSNEYLKWFQLFSVVPLLSFCYASSVAVLRVANKFFIISVTEIINAVLIFSGNLYLIFAKADWTEILTWMVTVAAIRGAILLWSIFYALKALNINNYFKLNLKNINSEFKEVFHLMLTSTLTFTIKTIHTQADTVIVGSILGPASSGAYKLARNIVQLLAFPTNALFQVSFPEFVRLLAKKNVLLFKKVLRNLILGTCGLAVTYCLGMWFVAPLVFPYFIGDSYSSGLNLLPILVVGLSLVLISQYWQAALVAINSAGQVAASMGVALLIQISILLLFVPLFGIQAAALAYVAYCGTRAALLYNRFNKYVTRSFKE